MVLVKEYRIPLPLTVEEYRVAQLYMIAVSTTTLACKHINTRTFFPKLFMKFLKHSDYVYADV